MKPTTHEVRLALFDAHFQEDKHGSGNSPVLVANVDGKNCLLREWTSAAPALACVGGVLPCVGGVLPCAGEVLIAAMPWATFCHPV
jgi:hypothetical protein